MGTLSSLASLMIVIAPLLGTPLLAEVSHLPAADWRVGLPYLLASALNLVALRMAYCISRDTPALPPALGAVR